MTTIPPAPRHTAPVTRAVRPARMCLDSGESAEPGAPAVPGVRVLSVRGALDRGAGARLLRLLDAHLSLVRAGTREIHHVVVDLTGAAGFDAGGVAALRHARYSCSRLGIGVSLAGCDTVRCPQAAALVGFERFPTVAVALTALAGRDGERGRTGLPAPRRGAR